MDGTYFMISYIAHIAYFIFESGKIKIYIHIYIYNKYICNHFVYTTTYRPVGRRVNIVYILLIFVVM